MTPAIEASGLAKRYGSVVALAGLDLTVAEGTVLGLLGPNGAGKSTLIKIIAGLLSHDGGEVLYEKAPLGRSIVRNIGFVFDEPLYLPYFSAKEYLEFVCRLIGMKPETYKTSIEEILAQFNLPSDRQPISTYSNGMKSKVSFGAAMIHAPEFLVLDEPFNGIDFITTRELVKILKQRAQEGTGILITSHQFDIIAELATHFSVLHESEIILSMPREQLHEEAEKLFADLPVGEAVKNYVENAILA